MRRADASAWWSTTSSTRGPEICGNESNRSCSRPLDPESDNAEVSTSPRSCATNAVRSG